MLKDKNVMVILCGSLVSMMVSQTFNYSNPLYGRRTGQIRLKQIPFRHYNEFFPGETGQELIEYYATTGGVPKYIELFYDSKDTFTKRSGIMLYQKPVFYTTNPVFYCNARLVRLAVTFQSSKP